MCSPSPAPLSFPCYDGRIHVFSLPNETNDDIAKPSIYILYVYGPNPREILMANSFSIPDTR